MPRGAVAASWYDSFSPDGALGINYRPASNLEPRISDLTRLAAANPTKHGLRFAAAASAIGVQWFCGWDITAMEGRAN